MEGVCDGDVVGFEEGAGEVGSNVGGTITTTTTTGPEDGADVFAVTLFTGPEEGAGADGS